MAQEEFSKELIKELTKGCKTIEDLMAPQGKFKQLMKIMIEGMLEAKMAEHLGYEKHSMTGKNTGNNRNGKSSKQLRSHVGDIELVIPRDRNGEFEPQVVKRHQRDISSFDHKIISMYAKGMTTRDIQDHVKEIYGADISPTMVSLIIDKAMDLAVEWQNRPLESTYVVVYFDAIHYKVREDGKVICKAAYMCIGINCDGVRDILGIWIGEHEGARFWLGIFNELKQRGISNIFIACVDGLKGVPAAINSVFPRTEI